MKEILKELKLFLFLSIMKCRLMGSGHQSQRITLALEGTEPPASRSDPFTAEYPLERMLGGISVPAVRTGKTKVFLFLVVVVKPLSFSP